MTDRTLAWIALAVAVLALVSGIVHALTPTPPAHALRGAS